jgi:hypothetical protein
MFRYVIIVQYTGTHFNHFMQKNLTTRIPDWIPYMDPSRTRIQDLDSGLGFWIRIPDSDSGFGFRIPDSDSGFRFRILDSDSDSGFGFRIWILDSNLGFGSRF